MVIDIMKLNDKAIDNKFPIPDITEILDKLVKSNYFTTLDLKSGFLQIEIDPKDIKNSFFHRQKTLQIQKNAFQAQKRTQYISTTDELRFMRLSK